MGPNALDPGRYAEERIVPIYLAHSEAEAKEASCGTYLKLSLQAFCFLGLEEPRWVGTFLSHSNFWWW
jgi:hypothetical protein